MAELTSDFHTLMNTTMDLSSFFCASNGFFYPHEQTQNMEVADTQINQTPPPKLPGRKRIAIDELEISSAISTPQASENGIKRKKSSGKCKKEKNTDPEEEKSGEIVHVRARRGQATDSHSLAERVRRGKINERLRCLQDIIPGCYKSMGMAVMLDEIINYVQSLQNQVEFLSMKLAAASSFNDFSWETMALENFQRAKADEAKELERLIRKDAFSQLGPFDLFFK